MKRGDKGVKVAELQADLLKLGIDPGPRDGVFGPKTEAAVRMFQQREKLPVTGVVDNATQARLTERVSIKPRPAANKQLSKNFNEMEFACRHCGQVHVEPELVAKLQTLRDSLGRPITVTSGYRCPIHNRNIGGATQSRHMQGQAADLTVNGVSPTAVATAADRVGFGGIGIYVKSGFTHVDVGPSRRWNG